jgi:hypothetical protein
VSAERYSDCSTSVSSLRCLSTQAPPPLAPLKPTGRTGGDGETAPPRTYLRPLVDGPTYARWLVRLEVVLAAPPTQTVGLASTPTLLQLAAGGGSSRQAASG